MRADASLSVVDARPADATDRCYSGTVSLYGTDGSKWLVDLIVSSEPKLKGRADWVFEIETVGESVTLIAREIHYTRLEKTTSYIKYTGGKILGNLRKLRSLKG